MACHNDHCNTVIKNCRNDLCSKKVIPYKGNDAVNEKGQERSSEESAVCKEGKCTIRKVECVDGVCKEDTNTEDGNYNTVSSYEWTACHNNNCHRIVKNCKNG